MSPNSCPKNENVCCTYNNEFQSFSSQHLYLICLEKKYLLWWDFMKPWLHETHHSSLITWLICLLDGVYSDWVAPDVWLTYNIPPKYVGDVFFLFCYFYQFSIIDAYWSQCMTFHVLVNWAWRWLKWTGVWPHQYLSECEHHTVPGLLIHPFINSFIVHSLRFLSLFFSFFLPFPIFLLYFFISVFL